MLLDLESLKGSSVIASDGEIGTVSNFLFDGLSWRIHYLVVDVEPGSNGETWFSQFQQSNSLIGRRERSLSAWRKTKCAIAPMSIPKSPFLASKKLRWRNTGGRWPIGYPPTLRRSFNSDRKEIPCPHQRRPASPERPGLT